MDWGILLGVIGIVIGTVSLAVAVPPFLQMIFGKAAAALDFDDSVESGSRVLLGRLHSRPVSNRLLRVLGIQRNAATVFVNFDICEHGTQKILAGHFRAMLTDPKSNIEGLSLSLEEPVPLIFGIVQHSDKGAIVHNSAHGEEKDVTLPPGEYFAEIKVGSRHGAIFKRRSFTVGAKKEMTFWSLRDPN